MIRPWTWAIVRGFKRIENRTWKPPASIVGQRIALHSGKKYDKESEAFIMDAISAIGGLPIDAEDEGIVGTAVVRGFLTNPSEIQDPEQAQWYFGPYGWVLDDARPLAEPVPCRGALGLWTVPADIERLISGVT